MGHSNACFLKEKVEQILLLLASLTASLRKDVNPESKVLKPIKSLVIQLAPSNVSNIDIQDSNPSSLNHRLQKKILN
jgi:hypothetical protein